MEKKYFPLNGEESGRLVKIVQVCFGIVCFVLAIYWSIFYIRTLVDHNRFWISTAFLFGFSIYMIWSGLGHARRFIEIGHDEIRLKKNIFLAPMTINAPEISKIALHPLNLVIHLKTGKKIFLRFGTTYQETAERIKDEIISFSSSNSIESYFIEEKL